MNTKYLMGISAVLLGLAGFIFIFFPKEILTFFQLSSAIANVLFLQILGALYFSFAVLNWMGKGNLIGGIYSKPVSLSNFAHFFMGGIILIKVVFANPNMLAFWIAGILYSIFAIFFGIVSFRNPIKRNVTPQNA